MSDYWPTLSSERQISFQLDHTAIILQGSLVIFHKSLPDPDFYMCKVALVQLPENLAFVIMRPSLQSFPR